jgi:hypothetical protein
VITKLNQSRDKVFAIIEKYNDYLKDRISFDDFYNKFLLPPLIERKYKNDFMNINTDSLDLLLINISEKYKAYRQLWDLGSEVDATEIKRKTILVAAEIVKTLENIRDSLSKGGRVIPEPQIVIPEPQIVIENGDIIREEDWAVLLKSIRGKKCIPFLGAEPFSPWVPFEATFKPNPSLEWTGNLSELWARDYGYPFEDSSQLSRVTEFIALDKDERMYPKRVLSEVMQRINSPDFAQTAFNDTPYAVMADLDLPIYVTTNYDHFLEEALKKRNREKKVVREICRWNETVNIFLKKAGVESILGRGRKYEPTPSTPLVYYLQGDMEIYQSMVLTERDYFEFINNLTIIGGGQILPSALRKKLATSSLLFIGYNLEEINFRFLLQCLLGLEVGDLREISIAVQLRPRLTSDKQKKAVKYVKRYIKDLNVRVYWGNSVDFCKDLRQRL